MDFLYCCLPSAYNSIPCGYDKEEEIWKKILFSWRIHRQFFNTSFGQQLKK